jgi:hypothetical protein
MVGLLACASEDGRANDEEDNGIGNTAATEDTSGETGEQTVVLDTGDEVPQGDGGMIWIANSNEGTVSKISTVTMEELGRYITRPDSMGSPSRTSVSLNGDVAVANREGGVVKIYNDTEDCANSNGEPGIQTSTGADDVLDWGDEECVAWYVPMTYGSQRAIAWTRGEGDPEGGEVTNEKIWVTGDNEADAGVDVKLLNGDDGTIEQELTIVLDAEGQGWPYRAYGGAVDRDSNFWFTSLGELGSIVRVNIEDMTVEQWPKDHQSYGITVDSKGRPWTCEVFAARFDPETGTWTKGDAWEWEFPGLYDIDMGGCMVDGENRLWVSAITDFGSTYGVAAIDGETLQPIKVIEIPDHAHGISIDFQGNVWGVARADIGPSDGTEAYKIDPEAGTYEVFSGLNGAYTYSDMTGFALSSTVNPPVG